MKTLLSLLLLCVNFQLFAQNYQCLQYGPKNYFINGNGYVRGIRIDSVSFPGSDELYYPYHTQRISNYLSSIIVDTFGASWLGKTVTQNTDGVFLFDNLWDTIIIQTQAHKGDTWTFFNDTTDRYYTATVTSEDTMTIHGATDSIKTMTINADSAGVPNPSDPVNNFQIILSKNNGFVQIFDLYTFPYRRPNTNTRNLFDYYLDIVLGNLGGGDAFPSNPPTATNSIFRLFNLHNPTMQEVYDFNVGDVFETEWTHRDKYPVEYKRLKTDSIMAMSKGLYSTSYTIVTREVSSMTNYGITTTVTVDYREPVIQTYIYDTSTLIDRNKMPEEAYLLNYYEKEFISNSQCDTEDSYVFNTDSRGTGFWYNGTGMIPYFAYQKYSPGFGMTRSETYNPPSDGTESTYYTYYSKGGKTCGTYVFPGTNGVETIPNKQAITIAPNPASDHISISMDSQPGADVHVSVYDATGKKLYQSQSENQNDKVINTSSWNSGLYLIIVQCGTNIIKKEKVIISK